MEKIYNPHDIEGRWYASWEAAGNFKPSGKGKPYCIVIPPPNVTGRLHMGHGFQHTLMDILIRYHRMLGDNTLWQVGTDHAGIATQMVVENQLTQQGTSREALGREAFTKKVWEWKHESGNVMCQQIRRMGASVDWSRECFTMDEGLSQAVQDVFIQLYEAGLIYRGKRLVNWDPVLHTAVSDLEVIPTPEAGHLWYIRYPLVDNEASLTIATTRPETLLGDTAVAVHPEDPRYQSLIGQFIQLPLCDRKIPIIADETVDREFGTGCVKITPAHDFNDYATGQRHNLPMINILTIDAKINNEAPAPYRGLDRFVARERILKDLNKLGLLIKTEPHQLNAPRGERSGTIIEPYLTEQWFLATQSLAEQALEAVQQSKIKLIPSVWYKTYFQWLTHIQDWCISRQLWWGHRIPAWYDPAGKIYVGRNEADVRERHQLGTEHTLTQEEDVLDTWFSAALWPFASLGWPTFTPELKSFYPTAVLVTGFDIIFFWVARMIMMGLKLTGQIPFHEVYITGLVRDSQGQKMSKSKGNILDPIDLIDGIALDELIEKRTRNLLQPKMAKSISESTRKEFPNGIAAHGTDALRFTFCALASTGRDIRFDINRLLGYRNFCNKLWNAAHYVFANCADHDIQSDKKYSLIDQWIQSILQETIQEARKALEEYRFDLFAKIIYEFTWNEYCDWYLELSKPILTNPGSQALARGTRHTLVTVLETLLRLIHPVMPFITEEIWQEVSAILLKPSPAPSAHPLPQAGEGNLSRPKSIMQQAYPEYNSSHINQEACTEIQWIKDIVIGIRTIRAEMRIAPGRLIPLLLHKGNQQDRERITQHQSFLTKLGKLASIEWLDTSTTPPPAASHLVDTLELLIPLHDLIDKDAEIMRINREITKLEKDLQAANTRLANPSYSEKAPPDVVAKEREKVRVMQNALTQLQEQYTKINTL